jgi:hypothetical protein
MTGAWDRAARGLAVTAFVSGITFPCLGVAWSRGLVWRCLLLGLALFWALSSLAAVVLVVVCWFKTRRDLRRYLDRPPLTDEEFAAALPAPAHLGVVHEVRHLIARHLEWAGWGDFYPRDRLVEDLHLDNLKGTGCEVFWYDLLEYLGMTEEELGAEAAGVVTVADIVLLADRLTRRQGGSPEL